MKIKNRQSGFTLIELFAVLGIIAILSVIIVTSFTGFRKDQALIKDTESIVETLRQARSQTLNSKDSYNYGVHLASSKITLFRGTSYDPATTTNQDFNLNSTDTIITITLTGGGNDVIFRKLSGETDQNGTVVVSAPGVPETRTVTIYKTGLIESQ